MQIRFTELSKEQLSAYIKAFEDKIAIAVKELKPDVILTNHLFVLFKTVFAP